MRRRSACEVGELTGRRRCGAGWATVAPATIGIGKDGARSASCFASGLPLVGQQRAPCRVPRCRTRGAFTLAGLHDRRAERVTASLAQPLVLGMEAAARRKGWWCSQRAAPLVPFRSRCSGASCIHIAGAVKAELVRSVTGWPPRAALDVRPPSTPLRVVGAWPQLRARRRCERGSTSRQ